MVKTVKRHMFCRFLAWPIYLFIAHECMWQVKISIFSISIYE